LLARAASTDQPTLGASAGAYAVARTVGVRPWWLRAPRGTQERIIDLQARPGVRTLVSAIVLLAGLGAVALVALRRRRHDVVAAVALALGLCAIVGMNAAAVPEPAIATVGYTMLWSSPAGMVVWLLLGWAIVTLAGGSRLVVRPGRPALLGLGATAIVATVVAVAADPPFEPFGQMRAVDERAVAATPAGQTVRVDRSARGFFPVVTAVRFQAGLVYALRRHGRTVRAPVLAEKLGSLYRAGPAERALRVDVDAPPPPGARTVMRFLVRPRSSALHLAPQVVRISSRRLSARHVPR
jgi:hypothetical protein